MYFRLDFLVDRLKLNDASLVFDFSPNQPITVIIKAENQVHTDGLTARGSVIIDQQVPPEVQEVFEAFAVVQQMAGANEDEPLPNPGDEVEGADNNAPDRDQPIPLAARQEERMEGDEQQEENVEDVTPKEQDKEVKQSTIGQQALDQLPEPFQQFARSIYVQLQDYAWRTTHLLRWRARVAGPHNPISFFAGWLWSLDKEHWELMPPYAGITATANFTSPVELSDEQSHQIIQYVEQKESEPLGHVLFREAWSQQEENPRSALVLGVMAVEIGIKQCIGKLVPETKWLVEHSPSPPVYEMLIKYLPSLQERSPNLQKVPKVPKELSNAIRDAVEQRNTLVHRGEQEKLDDKKLKQLLFAVRDLLWLFDYYCGFDWALEYLRPEIRQKL